MCADFAIFLWLDFSNFGSGKCANSADDSCRNGPNCLSWIRGVLAKLLFIRLDTFSRNEDSCTITRLSFIRDGVIYKANELYCHDGKEQSVGVFALRTNLTSFCNRLNLAHEKASRSKTPGLRGPGEVFAVYNVSLEAVSFAMSCIAIGNPDANGSYGHAGNGGI